MAFNRELCWNTLIHLNFSFILCRSQGWHQALIRLELLRKRSSTRLCYGSDQSNIKQIIGHMHAPWCYLTNQIIKAGTIKVFLGWQRLIKVKWQQELNRPRCPMPVVSFTMASSNGNIFRVTGILCGEFSNHWWIPRTKASDAELWCFIWRFLWSAPE